MQLKITALIENVVSDKIVIADQAFSDMTMEFDINDDLFYEEIGEVEEPLELIAKVVTPIDQDYRGTTTGDLRGQYATEPELAFYYGTKSKKVYMQDLLNDGSVSVLTVTYLKLTRLLQKHTRVPQHDNVVSLK